MKKNTFIKFLLSFIIYNIQYKKILSEETSWIDPITGLHYDWSKLQKNINNPYIIKDSEFDEENFSLKYYFNIGKNLPFKCKNKTASIIEFLEYDDKKTEICEILGNSEKLNIYFIDKNEPNKGIILEYGDGDICKTSQDEELMGYPRKTRFKIFCDNKDNKNFVLDLPEGKQGSTKCILDFKIYSTVGCPKNYLFIIKSSVILFYLLIIFMIYIISGYLYNYFYYKLRGKAAIPNYIFWRQYPYLIKEGIYYLKDIIKIAINKILNKCINKNKKNI